MAQLHNSTDNLFAALDGGHAQDGKSSSNSLSYPSNIGTQDQHSWILFDIYETQSAKFETTRDSQQVGAALGAMVGATLLQGGEGTVGAIAGAGAKAAATVSLIGSIDDLYNAMGTNVAAENSLYTTPQTKSKQSIALYMPASITNKDGFQYSDIGMGKMRDIAGLKDAGVDMFMNLGKGEIQGPATTQTQESKMAFELGALEKVSDSAAALRMKSMGATINPRMEMLFKGVNFREFSFEFIFKPESFDEHETVMKIIKSFRKHAYPELSGGGRFYIMPAEFEISYQFQGGPNPHVHKIKRCYCTNIDTDWTDGGGWRVLPDGRPAHIKLALSFKETKQVTSQDIEGGY
jgi:hypothetical protein